MTICVYTKTWRSSGTGLFAQELAHALAAGGAEVLFLAPAGESPRFQDAAPRLRRWTPPRELPVTAPKLQRAFVSAARVISAFGLLLAARTKTRKFIVTIPDPLVFSLPAFALLRLSGAEIVYVVHDPEPHAWRLPPALRFVERAGFQLAHSLATRLVVLSEPSKTALAPRVAPRALIDVIEHGSFSLGVQSPAPGAGRFLVFGTLRRNKGVRDAIEGVLEARRRGLDARLLIAGEPDAMEPDYWRACEALTRAHPDVIETRVGYVPDEALPALLAEVDAFLLPYHEFHSQSGVAILAASNNRPVVASPAGGIGALMAEGLPSVSIAPPGDGESVANALAEFLRTPAAEWDRRCAAFSVVMAASRSWNRIAADYQRLLADSASRNTPATA